MLLWFKKIIMAVQTFHFLVPKSLFSVVGGKTMFKIITIMEMHTLRRVSMT